MLLYIKLRIDKYFSSSSGWCMCVMHSYYKQLKVAVHFIAGALYTQYV